MTAGLQREGPPETAGLRRSDLRPFTPAGLRDPGSPTLKLSGRPTESESVTALALLTLEQLVAWATVGTAAGTLILAAATYIMARRTGALAKSSSDELGLLNEQTEAARRQSIAAEAALRASVRPYLLDVPRGTMKTIARGDVFPYVLAGFRRHPPPSETRVVDLSIVDQYLPPHDEGSPELDYWLRVPVRNVGAGVAILGDTHLVLHGHGRVLTGTTSANALPPGEVAGLVFEVEPGAWEWDAAERSALARSPVTATVMYTDSAGEQAARAQIQLLVDEAKDYYVADARVVEAGAHLPAVDVIPS